MRAYQDVEDMLSRLDHGMCDEEDIAMLRADLARMDLDYGLRTVYADADAEDRAIAFLVAASQPEHAGRFSDPHTRS